MFLLRTATVCAAFLMATSLLPGQSEEFGAWKTLFNGKDTAGWFNAKYPERAQKLEPSRWTVEDGALTNTAGGVDDLATEGQFENYELELEYKVPKGGNSGVYLRGWIEVQVFDSYGKPVDKLEGSDAGAIYGGKLPMANPQKPAGEWNAFKIRHIGSRITVWHNGTLVQDNVYVEGPTPSNMTHAPKDPNAKLDGKRGPIMLQGDHSKIWYRNIRIRPLASGEGWRPIWNGKDLSAFTSGGQKIEECWGIVENAITNAGKKSRRDMWTKESFGNFLVHYEYKSGTTGSGNSGFYLRDQWEIQINGDQQPNGLHTDGALYSLYPPLAMARNGRANWNHMDVKVEGMKISVWQNGTLIHADRVCETRTDDHGTKTAAFSAKPFKFQGDHDEVHFTNIYIKPLPDSK